MTKDDFAALAGQITDDLGGKTIVRATLSEWGMGYSITLHFTDGTSIEIAPEHDEGFIFSKATQT